MYSRLFPELPVGRSCCCPQWQLVDNVPFISCLSSLSLSTPRPVFPGLTSYINFDLEGPAAGVTQIKDFPLVTSGALLLPPFFLLDKGFISIDIFAVSPHTPVVDLGKPTLKTTESKTLGFIHISLSLSYCESRPWPHLPPVSHASPPRVCPAGLSDLSASHVYFPSRLTVSLCFFLSVL